MFSSTLLYLSAEPAAATGGAVSQQQCVRGRLGVCSVSAVWLLMMIMMMVTNVTLTVGSPPPQLCCHCPDGSAAL